MQAEEQKQIYMQLLTSKCREFVTDYARAELILDESAPAESASSRLKKEPSSRWA